MLLLGQALGLATDWPQYRGPTTDGISPDPISTTWAINSPGFVVWTNASLTNGFSSFAVSQGRAFTLMSKTNGTGSLLEYCAGVDAATGTNLWATPIDTETCDPNSYSYGGAGTPPYGKGDGPRTTPSVKDGRVIALSGRLHLVCLNAANGSVIWSNDLVSACGASYSFYQNGASPCLDDDLFFVNLNTSTNDQNIVALRTADGGLAWSSQAEEATFATPVVATIQGVRQVILATMTGLVSLDRTTGAFLWKFSYPVGSAGDRFGASPAVYSNIVFCTSATGGPSPWRGAAAIQITVAGSTWTATQLYCTNGSSYQSMWSSPVCYQGFVYEVGGGASFLTAPLTCMELSTGKMMWATNGFGLGGLILVHTNLLVLTETGQLVLVQPNPNSYV